MANSTLSTNRYPKRRRRPICSSPFCPEPSLNQCSCLAFIDQFIPCHAPPSLATGIFPMAQLASRSWWTEASFNTAPATKPLLSN
ncbi:uncharacterized protein TrAFT101_000607 [Trichoderma asperellum]|uniref:uncharacterized protein n=1 Tax=Trichoderma asperellum TaxID=101201 RepID=UPI00331CCE58|nr:hypothetical protein TrAFT101_000607 [Trichoderma asperellum]